MTQEKETALNLALTSYKAMERQANQLVIEILEEEKKNEKD